MAGAKGPLTPRLWGGVMLRGGREALHLYVVRNTGVRSWVTPHPPTFLCHVIQFSQQREFTVGTGHLSPVPGVTRPQKSEWPGFCPRKHWKQAGTQPHGIWCRYVWQLHDLSL